MTRPGIEPANSRTRGGRLNHWANEAVIHFSGLHFAKWYLWRFVFSNTSTQLAINKIHNILLFWVLCLQYTEVKNDAVCQYIPETARIQKRLLMTCIPPSNMLTQNIRLANIHYSMKKDFTEVGHFSADSLRKKSVQIQKAESVSDARALLICTC